MDLILWRHAEAEDGADDAGRRLTQKGVKQAARMAAWLDSRLPNDAHMLVSPAVRAQQTAEALARPAETSEQVKTGARAAEVLKAVGWPNGSGTVVVVGHQPTLGAVAALALTGKASPWRIKKAGLWWISVEGAAQPAVLAVMTPDLIEGSAVRRPKK
jgi:phosphohistidine phosphatase